jgi:hypothetical protein
MKEKLIPKHACLLPVSFILAFMILLTFAHRNPVSVLQGQKVIRWWCNRSILDKFDDLHDISGNPRAEN